MICFIQDLIGSEVTFKEVTLLLEEREPKLKALVEATPRITVRANMIFERLLMKFLLRYSNSDRIF
jgi:hypothetical protein